MRSLPLFVLPRLLVHPRSPPPPPSIPAPRPPCQQQLQQQQLDAVPSLRRVMPPPPIPLLLLVKAVVRRSCWCCRCWSGRLPRRDMAAVTSPSAVVALITNAALRDGRPQFLLLPRCLTVAMVLASPRLSLHPLPLFYPHPNPPPGDQTKKPSREKWIS